MSKFLTLYPGIYLPEEKKAMAEYRAKIEAVNSRTVDIGDVVSGKVVLEAPGGPSVVNVAEASAKKVNLWAPDDPIFSGENAIAFPTCAMPNGGFFGGLTAGFGDEKCVREHHHYCTFHRPLLNSDTLFIVVDNMEFFDITPACGSEYRTWAMRGTGKYYNQNGELVITQTCGAKECFKIYADPDARTWNARMEDFDWSNHAFHRYTDEDWNAIAEMWQAEQIRGSQILYFEDVSVGDTPLPTVVGPVTVPGKMPLANGPSMSDRYVKSHWDEAKSDWVRDEFGIWHVPAEETKELESQIRPGGPPPRKPKPEGEKEPIDNSPPAIRGRASFENYTGRDAAVQAIFNWMGEHGTLTALSWCIGSEPMMETHNIPAHPNRVSSFLKVPGMEDRFTDIHGEAGDLIISRIYVTGKNDETSTVEITWWTETIEGQIFTEGTAEVVLPKKQ